MGDPSTHKEHSSGNGGPDSQRQQKLAHLLEVLKAAAASLSSISESEQVPNIIANKISELADADGCMLRRWDKKQGVFTFLYGTGLGKWVTEKELVQLKIDESPFASILIKKELLEFHLDEQLDQIKRDWISRFKATNLVVIPLIAHAQVIGLVELYNTGNRAFDQDNLLAADLFAGHASATLDSLILYENMRQVSENQVKLEEQLRHDALHDPLTKIANHVMFDNSLEQAILRKRRNDDYNFMVICIDLDRFSEINESFGYAIGDQLLQTIAQRLNASVREGDTVARFNSDTFMIIVDGFINDDTVTNFGERIYSVLQTPFVINGSQIIVTGSIGIVVSTNGRTTPTDYFHDAKAAMRSAKSTPELHYVIFSDQIAQEENNQLEIENELRRAITNREFVMYYQPIVSLEDGSLKGMESLVRWENPERGLVLPNDFIPLAEQTGMIIDIGYLLLDQVCGSLAKWEKSNGYFKSKILSVNISGKQLTQPGFIKRVNAILDKYNLDPRNLVFEVTESIFIKEMESVYLTLVKLNELGIRVFLDDFGTGYSSLSYLNELPVQAIKLNQTFISTLCNNQKQETLVGTIISLAKNIGLEVIAEGIEEKEQVDLLMRLGCSTGQGYLYAKPLKHEDMDRLLLSKHALPENPE